MLWMLLVVKCILIWLQQVSNRRNIPLKSKRKSGVGTR